MPGSQKHIPEPDIPLALVPNDDDVNNSRILGALRSISNYMIARFDQISNKLDKQEDQATKLAFNFDIVRDSVKRQDRIISEFTSGLNTRFDEFDSIISSLKEYVKRHEDAVKTQEEDLKKQEEDLKLQKEILSAQKRQISQHDIEIETAHEKIEEVDDKVEKIDDKVEKVDTKVEKVDDRMITVEKKVLTPERLQGGVASVGVGGVGYILYNLINAWGKHKGWW